MGPSSSSSSRASTSVTHEMSNARSPVLSHFGAAVAGIVSICVYSAQNSFKQEPSRRIDKVPLPSRASCDLNVKQVDPDPANAAGTIFSSVLAIYLVYGTGAIHKPGSAANIGFSLSMAAGFSSMILWWARRLNKFEVNPVNVSVLPVAQEAERLESFEDEHHDHPAGSGVARRHAPKELRSSEDDKGGITLETAISSGGGNLSIGQCQILALARAIVRRSKLPTLDEVTSAVDYEKEAIIQNSLCTNFRLDVTLFTIARRLLKISDTDKIPLMLETSLNSGSQRIPQIKGGKLKALIDESGDKDTVYNMTQ
ncbi:hypothetical protein BDM02DRAFT_3188687 [Thelephora ganbajun]|uniref:Uncharacterized protein n=1 Tax=Thelephora ganbajun TaxID=370292 RepID=A0ACB6ZAX8_THEGA|nr:hypothetical protein BDM02DRAFT_3188687 [Thelephora ganbajun]